MKQGAVLEIVEFRRNANFVPASFLASWRAVTNFSLKIFRHFLNRRSQRLSSQEYDRWLNPFSPLLYEEKERSWNVKQSQNITQENPRKNTLINKKIGTQFWAAEGCILVEFSSQGKTFNISGNRAEVWLSCDVFLFISSPNCETNFLGSFCMSRVVFMFDWICVLVWNSSPSDFLSFYYFTSSKNFLEVLL